MYYYDVEVKVRQRNAIGIFWNKWFAIKSDKPITTNEELKDLWIKQYGNEWELSHFMNIDLGDFYTHEWKHSIRP